MLRLRVEAGPHSRRSCPVSVLTDLDPVQPVILYQEPGHRARNCQLEPAGTGSRVWWLLTHLDAGAQQEYQLLPVLQRRKPYTHLRWDTPAPDRFRVNLDGQPVAV